MTRPVRDDLEDLINTTAYRVYRRYRQWTEAADIRQEMWLWAMSVPEGAMSTMEKNRLRWKLHDSGLAYARAEKATRSGYHADDEVYYAIRVIRELLPVAIDDTPVVLRGVNEAERSSGRRAGAAPAMDYETAIADLRKAYRRLPDPQRTLLAGYVEGADVDEAAVNAALRSMQRRLGGRKPQREAMNV